MAKTKDLPKTKKSKTIKEILNKTCAVCGRKIKVVLYNNHTYRGGHYFGKIPLFTKKVLREADKAGTHKEKIGDWKIDVMNKDPKPYDHAEYWECPTCYWHGKNGGITPLKLKK